MNISEATRAIRASRDQRGSASDAVIFSLVGLAVVFVLGLIVGIPIYTIASYQNEQVRTCTVEDKDRAGRDGEMRVYTDDCGNLRVADALFKRNFHASDTYREIEVGRTYEFTTIGFRIPFLSEFPNIIEASEVAS